MKIFPSLLPLTAFFILALSPLTADTDRGMVWKLESPTATVFLAGSVHFLSPHDHPLPAPYETAYEASQKIVFETDMAELFSSSTQTLLHRASALPEGTTLSEVLEPETFAALNQFLEERELRLGNFAEKQPWHIATSLVSLELMLMGITPMSGVDMHFYQKARRDGKERGALESVEFQIGLFSGLSMAEQDRLLQSALVDIANLGEEMTTMVGHWRHGRTEDLAAYLIAGMEAFPELRQVVLDDRNRDWIPSIEAFLEGDQNVMVVVGAGHLVGPNSVIDLLERQGHTPVRRED